MATKRVNVLESCMVTDYWRCDLMSWCVLWRCMLKGNERNVYDSCT